MPGDDSRSCDQVAAIGDTVEVLYLHYDQFVQAERVLSLVGEVQANDEHGLAIRSAPHTLWCLPWADITAVAPA